MSSWKICQQIDLARGAVEPRILPSALLMQGDKLAHEWRIAVLQDGQPAVLAGTVRGYFQRADGNYVTITGTIDEHTAVVKLESTCYVIPGPLQCVMRLTNTSGDNTITLGVVTLPVEREPSGGVVDVEHIIPDLGQLLAQIEAMETGTAAATAAATAANMAAGTATNAAGQATEAAATAQIAATTAGNAASAAQSAASGVVAATDAAHAAAQEASDAASDAVLAAGDADDAADAANAAAGAANTAASAANAAKAAANTAAEAATSAAGQATSAAEAAQTGAAAANAAAAKIDGMTVETSVVPYGTTPVATITEVDGHKHVAIQTQRGPQGPGYTIKGAAYATLAALEAAVPSPAEGDQYNVGSTAPYHVYRWTGAAWEDQGELQGPEGDDGFSPVASVNKVGNTATITITDKVGSTSAQVTDGTDGDDGDDGVTFTPAVSSAGVISFTNDGGLANPPPVDLAAATAAVVPAVRYDASQGLTAPQKTQAIKNMFGNYGSTEVTALNDILLSGLYYAQSTATNIPASGNWFIVHINLPTGDTSALQLAFRGSYHNAYVRMKTASNTWLAWSKVYTDADVATMYDFTTVSEATNAFACDFTSLRHKNFRCDITNTTAKTITFTNVPTGYVVCELKIKATAVNVPVFTLDGRAKVWKDGSQPLFSANTVTDILCEWDDSISKWVLRAATAVSV